MTQQPNGFRRFLVLFASALLALTAAEFALKFVPWPSLLEILLKALVLVVAWRVMQLLGWLPPANENDTH